MSKNERGTLSDFKTFVSLQNIKQLEGGPSEDNKVLVSLGKKTKGGTLCSKFPLAGNGLSSFGSFCEKWTFQCEVCALEKKVTVRGAIFAPPKAPTKSALIRQINVLSKFIGSCQDEGKVNNTVFSDCSFGTYS